MWENKLLIFVSCLTEEVQNTDGKHQGHRKMRNKYPLCLEDKFETIICG